MHGEDAWRVAGTDTEQEAALTAIVAQVGGIEVGADVRVQDEAAGSGNGRGRRPCRDVLGGGGAGRGEKEYGEAQCRMGRCRIESPGH